MKTVELTQGKVAVVDDGDLPQIARYNWYVEKRGCKLYARTDIWRGRDLPRQRVYMHRLLCSTSAEVDHIDGDGLNNQRSNLRAATHAENMANQRKTRGASKYKGVTPSRRRWVAQLSIKKKRIYLGSFATEEEAARTYDRASVQHFGMFARLNFPEEMWLEAD